MKRSKAIKGAAVIDMFQHYFSNFPVDHNLHSIFRKIFVTHDTWFNSYQLDFPNSCHCFPSLEEKEISIRLKYSAASGSFSTSPIQKCFFLQQTCLTTPHCSAKQQLLARLFPAATVALQLSILEPSSNSPSDSIGLETRTGRGRVLGGPSTLMSQN